MLTVFLILFCVAVWGAFALLVARFCGFNRLNDDE